MSRLLRVMIGLFCGTLLAVPAAHAGPPDGFRIRSMISGLDAPTAFAYAPDGRILITEKKGIVWSFDEGRLHEFLDLRDEVNEYSDRGLNNVAVDGRGRVYLFYTEELRPDDPDKGHPAGGRLIRVEGKEDDPNVAEPESLVTLVSGFDSHGPYHSVGGLEFDPAGNLVLGFGDGSPYFPKGFTPAGFVTYDLTSLSGKILRIDPETGRGVPGNPYYNPARPAAVRSKVIATGFRMPYRIAIDPETESIYVGDVGTDQWEEVDLLPTSLRAGLNYGWPCYEGGDRRYVDQPFCISRFYSAENEEHLTERPAYAYSGKGGAALVLGPVYPEGPYPEEYAGRVFLADFIRDRFWTYEDGDAHDFGSPGNWGGKPGKLNGLTDLELTPRGTIAYTALFTGRLSEIVYVGGADAGFSFRDAVPWVGGAIGAIGVALAIFFFWRRPTNS